MCTSRLRLHNSRREPLLYTVQLHTHPLHGASNCNDFVQVTVPALFRARCYLIDDMLLLYPCSDADMGQGSGQESSGDTKGVQLLTGSIASLFVCWGASGGSTGVHKVIQQIG